MSDFSYVFNAHPSYIDTMYLRFKDDPKSIEDGWRTFFEGFEFASSGNGTTASAPSSAFSSDEFKVIGLINGYRRRGHLLSKTNPIKERRDRSPHLSIEDFGLSEADLDKEFLAGHEIGLGSTTLRQILEKLQRIYCRSIGLEYFYIAEKAKRRWLRQKLESFNEDDYGHSLDKKKRILEKLNGAVVFEKFLHTKYVGQKRFSLEGGESTIPALDAIINAASNAAQLYGPDEEVNDVKEVIIGMAHRGRLNVLANIMGKTYEQIFNEFEGKAQPDTTMGDGDVKYHKGYSSLVTTTQDKEVHLKLVPNPSHLEAVNPVVEGFARAKADILYGSEYDSILPILIHGDAAIAGQGVMYETVQMSKLPGYYTGGTIHFVINNQIGFTTNWDDARSSTYCTSVASIIEAPVIHVNGDDPEAVVFAAELALQYRQKFNSDIFIDMVCYRRHGHNEGDDPKFTQPEMYKAIKNHPNPRDIYSDYLINKGEVEAKLATEMNEEFWKFLQERLDMVKEKPLPYKYQEPEQAWRKLRRTRNPEDFRISPETGVEKEILEKIVNHLVTIPDNFSPLSKVNRLMKGMKDKIEKNEYDWALGELMAYGSMLLDGKDIRMSGQDVKRGTFSHRHLVLSDAKNFKEHNRLNSIEENQGLFRIYNSFLSEFAVLGFEFGYSMASPDTLVVWEAQFGDFANGAQVMIDQFITSAESKWRRMSGLVMLLPHGYEGQGPEHSSARLERFLQMCAEYNMTVANVTKPANFFHLLHRQLARPFRKPLVVMSPKSMLRHPEAVSPIEDFLPGTKFEEVYDDPIAGKEDNLKNIKKVLWCSGKIYYDLLKKQREEERYDVAIVRLEQLYPFPKEKCDDINRKYGKEVKFAWVQEEPSNMGAWAFILSIYQKYDLELVARKPSASPATGYASVHQKEQEDILTRAFSVA